jgi:hypothetical protein
LARDICTDLKFPEFSGYNDTDFCHLLVNDLINSNSVLNIADLSGLSDVHQCNFNNFSDDVINIFGLNFAYSEFSHLNNCYSKTNCATCTTLISNYFTYVHSNLGFLPLFAFPVSTSISANHSIPVITSNINSYISLQIFYTGSPNFISKLAPVASYINIKILNF